MVSRVSKILKKKSSQGDRNNNNRKISKNSLTISRRVSRNRKPLVAPKIVVTEHNNSARSRLNDTWDNVSNESFLRMEELCNKQDGNDLSDLTFSMDFSLFSTHKMDPSKASTFIINSPAPHQTGLEPFDDTIDRVSNNKKLEEVAEVIEVTEAVDEDEDDDERSPRHQFNDTIEAVEFFISQGERLHPEVAEGVSRRRAKILNDLASEEIAENP